MTERLRQGDRVTKRDKVTGRQTERHCHRVTQRDKVALRQTERGDIVSERETR